MINNSDSTKYYTNGVVTIKVKPNEEIPDGFHLGRTFNSNPWNKGLTSETDERVRLGGQKTRQTRLSNGSYENPWNKGLTADNNSSLKTVGNKVHQARQNRFWTTTLGRPKSDEEKLKQSIAMQGKPAWNKGLTKDADERVQNAANKLKGHKCFVTDWSAAKAKEYLTKKLNNSFNTSKPELQYLSEFQATYGIDNVISQYQDARYKNPKTGRPFICDFYIKSEDLFIEINFHWTHNTHPFDVDSDEDYEVLTKLQYKASTEPSKTSYLDAIRTWTETDPMKLAEFRKNNLNFMIFYPNGLVIDK